MRMSEQNRINTLDVRAKRLSAKIGRGVDQHHPVVIADQDRGAQAIIARVRRPAYFAAATHRGHAGACTRPEYRDMNRPLAHQEAASESPGSGLSALGAALVSRAFSLIWTKRKRSSVREFSIRRCSSRDRLLRVF